MNQFKKDDLVVCIDDSSSSNNLIKYKVYKVTDFIPGCYLSIIYIIDDNGTQTGWFSDRFELKEKRVYSVCFDVL